MNKRKNVSTKMNLSLLVMISVLLTGCAKANNSSVSSSSDFSSSLSSSLLSKYTVTWKNDDGSVLETDLNVEEGTLPIYDGETPIKDKTAQYSYVFKGWDKAVAKVTGDTTYTATYTSSVNSYKVTWENYDGSVIKSEMVEYGTTPSYSGERPAKAADFDHVYVFDGWNEDVAPVKGEVVYKAKYLTEDNNLLYQLSDDGGYHVSADKDNTKQDIIKSLIIPDTYDDGVNGVRDVTVVEDFIMDGSDSLTSLSIGANVEEIYGYTFVGCSLLTSVSVGNKIRHISSMAFSNTGIQTAFSKSGEDIGYLTSGDGSVKYAMFAKDGIKSVSLDEKTIAIKNYLFENNTSLTKATLNENLALIGSSVFSGCSSLSELSVGSKLSSIDYAAFDSTALISAFNSSEDDLLYLSPESDPSVSYLIASKSKLEKATLKKGTRLLATGAFSMNDSLTSVTLNDDLSFLGSSSFEKCSKLASIVIPDSVTEIRDCCFQNCGLLSSVTLPKNLDRISDSTFAKCKSLKSIELPSSLKVIGDLAFSEAGLTAVSIPNSIENIEYNAFLKCQDIVEIKMTGDNDKYQVTGNCVIEKENHTMVLGCKASVIPSDGSVKVLGKYIFSGLTDFTSVSVPSSVTEIGENCFMNCTNLTQVTLNEGLKKIDDYAFEICSNLSSLVLPSSLTSIGRQAFERCNALSSIVIPSSVTVIGPSITWAHPLGYTDIFCEATAKPDTWNKDWDQNAKAVYWYSETSNTDGKHWRYVDGVPTVWAA